MNKTYVLYHACCADGFAAAFVLWLTAGEVPTYIPVAYGLPVPEMEDGSEVYIVDFSYDRKVLMELAQRMARVVVLDHHATARWELAAVAEVPGITAVYDADHSGAVMAWRYAIMDGEPVPELLRYVQDRDLWRWALPQSREVNAALASYPHDFKVWAELMGNVERLKVEGIVALRVIQEEARRVAQQATLTDFAGYRVPCVNATSYQSDVGHLMLDLFPKAPFAMLFRDEQKRRVYSLRSRKDFDCSVIARRYGGGGHAQACGFEAPMSGGVIRVALERMRQLGHFGWTAAHDDQHADGSLAQAAAGYAATAAEQSMHGLAELPANYGRPEWPWNAWDFRPSHDPIRNLEKAGAMIAAEIDRVERKREREREGEVDMPAVMSRLMGLRKAPRAKGEAGATPEAQPEGAAGE